LNKDVVAISRVLEANGVLLRDDEGYLVLPEFYQWFHDDVFTYHVTAVGEFLNNIRWGVYEYLRAEFERSFKREPPPSVDYNYIYPAGCNSPVVQAIYWDLMNSVRQEPFMPKFETTRYLKMRY
jgi:hypothetical protein